MAGTILILDATPTSRMMLKVQLSAGYYRVVQGETLADAEAAIRRARPDLIVAAAALPDATVADLCALRDKLTPDLPLLMLTAQNDQAARLDALRMGADDVMSRPISDLELRARIRRLVRQRNLAEDLRPRDSANRAMGLAEAGVTFARPASVALVSSDSRRTAILRNRLAPLTAHSLRAMTLQDLLDESARGAGHDAILIAPAAGRAGEADLRLLADLRSRTATRHAAVLILADASVPCRAAEALDLGADDVVTAATDLQETVLRLDRQLAVKQQADQLRDTLQRGLRAAVRDPLTGLFNRRFALPYLARRAQEGPPFAVMLIDIDHFKRVNDRFGHQAGDRVIAETAARLRSALGPDDMLARVGGEEFLVVATLPDGADPLAGAQTFRTCIGSRPFHVGPLDQPVTITVSIGLATGPTSRRVTPEAEVHALIGAADHALYDAKRRGRDAVAAVPPAA